MENIQLSDLFLISFIHKSYAADFKIISSHNERLEFLGDWILGAVICKLLFQNNQDFSEATMSLYKIALVREETLASVARDIKLNEMIFISKGEEKADWRNKDTILGDCFEAFLGRMYLEYGENQVFQFIQTYLYPKMKDAVSRPVKSYKSLVQEATLKSIQKLPEYRNSQNKKPTNEDETFISELFIDNKKVSQWLGRSKKNAESEAARLFWENFSLAE